MTFQEFVNVLANPANGLFPQTLPKDSLVQYAKKFYLSEMEEWEFHPGGSRVIALHKFQTITPDFFKELMDKRKKVLDDLPFHSFPQTYQYIKAAIAAYKGDRT